MAKNYFCYTVHKTSFLQIKSFVPHETFPPCLLKRQGLLIGQWLINDVMCWIGQDKLDIDSSVHSPACSTFCVPKKGEQDLAKKPTAPGVPRRSPIQVLTWPNVAWLRWSDENRYFQRGMAVDKDKCWIFTIIKKLRPTSSPLHDDRVISIAILIHQNVILFKAL